MLAFVGDGAPAIQATEIDGVPGSDFGALAQEGAQGGGDAVEFSAGGFGSGVVIECEVEDGDGDGEPAFAWLRSGKSFHVPDVAEEGVVGGVWF